MLKKIWDGLEENILIYSYLLVIPLLFAQVVFRYVFNNALTWSEELARYLFIWQIWLGSSYCVQKNRHIRIDIFTDKLSPRMQKIYEIIITIVSIIFCAFLVYKGGTVMLKVKKMHQMSPALKMPMWILYSCIPISCTLMILRYLEHISNVIKGNKQLKEEA